MKKFKDVEADRKKYHRDPDLNSVHRTSLMVPELPGAVAEISFLNHFLLKRGYRQVGCRITAIDLAGKRILARLYEVNEPRVYRFTLTGMTSEPVGVYMVEFFAAENLFIPFPAVMVNHRADSFVNQVHSFNRLLNDVFEDDIINRSHQKEASIDLILDQETDTFVQFMAGMRPCNDKLELEAFVGGERYVASAPVDVPRFCTRWVSAREVFAGLPREVRGTLKVKQPVQSMFYGRLLAGQIFKNAAISANHSYYDSSSTEEYWSDARPSQRPYPYLRELENVIRMHPIMSPGNLSVVIQLNAADGKTLAEVPVGGIESPGTRFIDANVNELARKAGVDGGKIAAFVVRAAPNGGDTPTRVNHQLVYGDKGLFSSINMSLQNPNVFNPKDKKSFTWGQVVAGDQYDSFIGLVGDDMYGEGGEYDCEMTFYGPRGELARRELKVSARGGQCFEVRRELARELSGLSLKEPEYLWYSVKSSRLGVSSYTVARNKQSGHSSGEHGF